MLYLLIAISIMAIFTALAYKRGAVLYLMIAFFLIYALEFALYIIDFQSFVWLIINLACSPSNIIPGAITSIYVHSINPMHIFFNMIVFFLMGLPFEQRVGSRKFVIIFLVSGIAASVGYTAILLLSGTSAYLIGASGAIFGIMGAFLVLYPDDEIMMFLGPVLLPRVKVKYAVLLMMAVEFFASFMWVNDDIAHGAHIIGAVTGALVARALKDWNPSQRAVRRINFDMLKELADTQELMDIYEKIVAEDEPTIQRAWIKHFFEKKYGKKANFDGKYVYVDGTKIRVVK